MPTNFSPAASLKLAEAAETVPKERYESLRQEWIRQLENGCIPPPNREELANYVCGKCKTRGVKLWRGVHGYQSEEGHELLCASCLAPGVVVGDNGKIPCEYATNGTDQINGWLPAVPTDGSYWGYTSVPSQPRGWWIGLPTYPHDDRRRLIRLRELLIDFQFLDHIDSVLHGDVNGQIRALLTFKE